MARALLWVGAVAQRFVFPLESANRHAIDSDSGHRFR